MFRKLSVLFLFFGAFSGAFAQAPVAHINATPLSGCPPLAVSFNDASTGGTTGWTWSFPGGSPSSSTQKNPAIIYTTAGVYTATLVSKNASGSSAPVTVDINVFPAPAADFTQDKTSGCGPLNVQFTNTSSAGGGTATITSYAWTFGDGTQSTAVNPLHRFTLVGQFPVTLYVKNNFGCQGSAQIKNVQQAITITGLVAPNFTSSLNSSCSLPVTATFNNTSTGPPTLSYLWDFGDGSSTVTTVSPVHPYTAAGNYTVKLAVTSTAGCSDTLPLKVNITTNGNLTDFTMPDSVCVGTTVNFINISSPQPIGSSWTYYAGAPPDAKTNGQYTYPSPGTYAVTLTNSFGGCGGVQTKNIVVVNPPTANFTGTNLIGCKPPLTSTFTDASVGATSWAWNFGDGNTSTAKNPVNTFLTYNDFNVTLTASSTAGCSAIKTLVVKVEKPSVKIGGTIPFGCAPYTYTPVANGVSADGITNYSWDFGNGNTGTGQTPGSQSYGPGTYQVVVRMTTAGGCTASDTVKVKVGTVKPVPDFSFVPPTACVKTSVQFTDLTPAGTDDQWFWEFGDGNTDTVKNPKYSYLKPGIFLVRLTAYNNGCWDSLSKKITVNPPLADFKIATVCGQRNSFTFLDNSIGATGWTWDFGDGSPLSTAQNPPTHVFPPGATKTYTVTLTATAAGCSNSVSLPVTANQSTTLSFSASPVCLNTQFFITANAAANIVNFKFVYGDGNVSNGSSRSIGYFYPLPGTYQIKVITTDNSGCIDSSAVYPMVVNGPIVNFKGPLTDTSCSALTVNFTDLTTTVPAGNIKSWLWDFGDGNTSTQQNPTHSYSFQGIFVPRLTVTDNAGCVGKYDTAKPIIVSLPVPKFATSDSNYCPISVINFNNLSTGGFNPVYTWDFADGTPVSHAFAPTHMYSVIGKFTDTLTITDDYGCIKKFWNTTPINIDTPSATFTMSGNYSACPVFNDTFRFTGHYAQKYAWDFRDGGISQLQNPVNGYALPGDYWPFLIVTSPGGCIAKSDSQHVHIDGPVGTLDYSPLAACDSLTVNFKVTTTNVISFTWFFGDGSDSIKTAASAISHKYVTPGEFTPIVYITDAGGCRLPKVGQNFINIDAIKTPDFTESKNLLCDSGLVSFKDISVLGDGTVINNYIWDFGDGTPVANGPNPAITHNYTSIGNDSVAMTISSVGGCVDTRKLPLSVVASPKISINGILSQCQPAVLNYTGVETVPDPNGPLAWTWNFGNGQTGSGVTPGPVNYPKDGQYKVYVTALNTKGCSSKTNDTTYNLFIYPVPVVNAGADVTICDTSTLQLHATGDATTYNWLPPVNGTLSTLVGPDPLANSPVSTYFVVNGTTLHNCQTKDTIQVTVNTQVTVNASGTDSVCLGQSRQLNATGGAIFQWSPATGLSDPNIANPVATPVASQIGSLPSTVITYTVTGYDNKRCYSDSKSVDITAFNYPAMTISPDTKINVGSSYQINATASTNIVSLNWTPSNTLSCSNCLTPLATPIKTTRYILTAVNDGGCATSDSIRIQVVCDGANFFVPNTFSPNGDGKNDHFIVNGVGLNVIPSITIYNRWGQIVFQKSNFAANNPADAWDGTINGQPAPADVYVYTLQILCNNATLIPYHGNITLIR